MKNHSIKYFVSLIICFSMSHVFAQETISWKEALKQKQEWYASPEAISIANNVLLYQSENGGWPKNIDMADPITKEEVNELKRTNGKHINETTIDNRATYPQIEYLAKVYTASNNKKYKQACLDGIKYMLDAQYPNGGWPQFYPLRKGYYTHITFNDGAMIGVMEFLKRVANNEFNFINKELQEKANIAVTKGIEAILKCQVIVNGIPTVWCAQHDENTFEPTNARAYELKSLSGAESVGIVEFLMQIENPNEEVIAAVNNAVAWFQATKLQGLRLIKINNPEGKYGFDYVVGFDPTNTQPLWARFYEIGTNYPIFVGRDGTIRYSLGEIEIERRTGYKWLNNWAEKLITTDYPAWCEKWNVNLK